jgi:hypothetical protein
MSSRGFAFSSPPNPTQLDPTPSAHAVSSMDWIARLASDTANRVLSVATTMASGACATYEPLEATAPSDRSVSLSRTTMKCQGWRFMPLPVSRPASTIRRTTASGIGLSWYPRTARSVRTASKTSMCRLPRTLGPERAV